MEYTESQLAEFKEEYGRRRRRQWVVGGAMGAVALALVLFGRRSQSGAICGVVPAVWLSFLALVVVGALLFSWRNWRCPACGGHLGRSTRLNFCPRCGVALR